MRICPECSGEKCKIFETRLNIRGDRRTRYRCTLCEHRWTVYVQENEGEPYKVKWKDQVNRTDAHRRLCRDDVIAILTSKESQHSLSRQYGLTRQSISRIQLGLMYKDIYEEMGKPAQNKIRFCSTCVHWCKEECTFGFPEAGHRFATECFVYEAAQVATVLQ